MVAELNGDELEAGWFHLLCEEWTEVSEDGGGCVCWASGSVLSVASLTVLTMVAPLEASPTPCLW